MGLGCGDDLNPAGEEILHDRDEVAQAPAQPVQSPDENASKAALVSIGKKSREFWPAGGGTGAVLTVHPVDRDGVKRWELDDGATLYDVTHLPCRAARYTSATSGHSCTPADAERAAFPVPPGASMPAVEGCNKQDYAVLFVIGVAVDN